MAATLGRGEHTKRGRAERVALAQTLRRSCIDCGEPTTPVPYFRGDIELLKPGKCDCGGRGHELSEVAAKMGISRQAVSGYTASGSKRTKSATSRNRPCVECGTPMRTDSKAYRCEWCRKGEISPWLIENTTTSFRRFTRTDCTRPDCSNERAEGRRVCAEHAPFYDRIKAELEAERKTDAKEWRKRAAVAKRRLREAYEHDAAIAA